ncbi:PQQ-like beta-propeller repeat protein [Myxococcaceae bacterium JPH2]|nr:PQQ-like beta-propeller repeat protein [Myxococcaceae bacterium JPH2]
MLRNLLGAGVLLALGALAGCKPQNACSQDSDCASAALKCDTDVGLCYGVTPPEEKPDTCTPACAPYQACTVTGCKDRYSELAWLRPAGGATLDAGTTELAARLVADQYKQYPEQLAFLVERVGAGAVGTVEAVLGDDAGTYTTRWSPPAEDAEYRLSAAYPADGGPRSTPVTVRVNAVAPTVTVELLPGAASLGDGGTAFTYADPGAPTARRRDETAVVRIRSEATDVAADSLRISVRGVGAGAEFSPNAAQVTPCAAAAFCRDVTVPLWAPPLADFRGVFTATATVADTVGNVGGAEASIPVTRWRWSFAAGTTEIRNSPAIGSGGVVFFGTSRDKGNLFAVRPEGSVLWSHELGNITSGPLVGVGTGAREMVYVGADTSQTLTNAKWGLFAYSAASGATGPAVKCADSTGRIGGALAWMQVKLGAESSPLETVAGLADGDALIAVRPSGAGSAQCIKTLSVATSPLGTASVALDTDLYLGTAVSVAAYRLGGTGWANTPSFASPSIGFTMTGLALGKDATQLVSAGSRVTPATEATLARFQVADGGGVQPYPSTPEASQIQSLVVGSEADAGVAYFGRSHSDTGALSAVSVPDLRELRSAPNAGRFPNAPVLGEGGVLYTASATGAQSGVGEVTAWSTAGLTRLWRLSDSVGRVIADAPSGSPALDCARTSTGAARPESLGTLYVPGANGTLYAFIVDSRGLDSTAPWPRPQHDARNTGNPATPVSCP